MATSKNGTERAGDNLLYMDDFKTAIAVGFVGGLNVIGWGSGGHAKSLLRQQINEAWEQDGAVTSTQVVSVGTNVLDLAGGGHPEYFKNFIYDRPYVENSWIANSDVHWIEELFDASPRVMAYLKNILTERAFRYNDTVIELRPRMVIGLTNHDPSEISKQDPSVAALVERFPIQVCVMWPHYTDEDFRRMFQAISSGKADKRHKGNQFAMPSWPEINEMEPVKLDEDAVDALADFMGIASELGVYVSPRTAIYCGIMIGAYAAVTGNRTVELEHFDILRLAAGVGPRYREIIEKIEYKAGVRADLKIISEFTTQAEALLKKLESATPKQAVELAKAARGQFVAMNKRSFRDDTVSEANRARNTLKHIEEEALRMAGLAGGAE